MKYKKMKKRLENAQRWYDSQSKTFQAANKRPGSVKWR